MALLLLVTLGIRTNSQVYFELAMLIGLLGFVGTVALAKFLMRGEVIEKCVSKHGKEYSRRVCISTRLKAAEVLAKSQGAFLKGAIENEKKDINIIWVDDYGKDEDYPLEGG